MSPKGKQVHKVSMKASTFTLDEEENNSFTKFSTFKEIDFCLLKYFALYH